MTVSRRISLLIGLTTLTIIGCGGPPAASAVKVTVVSSKVKLEDTDSINVSFEPDGSGATAAASGSAKDQPLMAKGSNSTGVMPGKYKLAVKISPYQGQAPERVRAMGEFSQQFAVATTPLKCEITAEPEQAITIDLDAKTVTKK